MTSKRALDLILLLPLLPLFAAVVGVLALLVLVFDGRPVFFTQPRVGRNRKPFRIFKLRTMRQDAEQGGETPSAPVPAEAPAPSEPQEPEEPAEPAAMAAEAPQAGEAAASAEAMEIADTAEVAASAEPAEPAVPSRSHGRPRSCVRRRRRSPRSVRQRASVAGRGRSPPGCR